MKTTANIILRSLAATPLKIALVYAGIIGLLYVDFAPLPLWTGDALAYFVHFAVTYFLALWVLHGKSGRWLDGAVVAFNFIVISALLEIFLAALLRGPNTNLVTNLFTWQSGLINLCYLLGVGCAWIQARLTLTRDASQV
ncbi:hypothetical protein M0Q28_01725 [Patescibacteria group bacterium]|jgi:hypothetical protein|nr:hypothetical protein [Patescibacteria group bacterium]